LRHNNIEGQEDRGACTRQNEMTTVSVTPLEIPFHRACIDEREVQAIADVVRSGWLTMGPRTIEFERKFAEYVGAKHAIAVNSCTAALHLALEAAGVQRGDEVLVPTTTFTATAEVVHYLGAHPVLVDIDPLTLNMDPEDAARRITKRTRAVVPVHVAGQPCDLDAVHKFAGEYKLHVVEDAAHSLPASYKGRKIGSISDFTAFSFYATKTLTTGEGGMITTDIDEYADRMRIMRLHGIGRDAWKRYSAEGSWYYEVLDAGYKYNMTDMQAALGLVQLSKSDAMTQMRRSIAERYSEAFRCVDELETPVVHADRVSAWHLYVLRLHLDRLRIDRNSFINQLKERGIGTSVHFIPLHLHPFYARTYGYCRGDFPRAEQEYARSLSLPIFPGMTNEEVDYVTDSVIEVVRCSRR
jgi:dTDP-4-amino-4,6-dideoxygalactose transaminase